MLALVVREEEEVLRVAGEEVEGRGLVISCEQCRVAVRAILINGAAGSRRRTD